MEKMQNSWWGTDFKIMGLDNQFQYAGDVSFDGGDTIEMFISSSISNHLSNPVLFYSKLLKTQLFENASYYFLSIPIKYDDKWLIKHLKGPIKRQYLGIWVTFKHDRTPTVNVRYHDKYHKVFFNVTNSDITYKDVNKFYDIRKDANNLTKIRVTNCALKAYQGLQALWSAQSHFIEDQRVFYRDYVGPKTDEIEMMNTIRNYEDSNPRYDDKNKTIIVVDIEEGDMVSL